MRNEIDVYHGGDTRCGKVRPFEAMRLNAYKKAQQTKGYLSEISHFSDAHDPSGDS